MNIAPEQCQEARALLAEIQKALAKAPFWFAAQNRLRK
jgi:hypothetical protein